MPTVTFFYDLGSPYAYITADRIDLAVRHHRSPSTGSRSCSAGSSRRPAARPGQKRQPAPTASPRSPNAQPPTGHASRSTTQSPGPTTASTPCASPPGPTAPVPAAASPAPRFEVQFNDGLPLSDQENIELAAHRAGLDPDFALDATQDPDRQAGADRQHAGRDRHRRDRRPDDRRRRRGVLRRRRLHEAVAAAEPSCLPEAAVGVSSRAEAAKRDKPSAEGRRRQSGRRGHRAVSARAARSRRRTRGAGDDPQEARPATRSPASCASSCCRCWCCTSREAEPTYGNQLIDRITTLTGGVLTVNPNTMYPLLRDFEARGLIEGQWEHPERRSRRFYSLTNAGEEELARLTPGRARGARRARRRRSADIKAELDR